MNINRRIGFAALFSLTAGLMTVSSVSSSGQTPVAKPGPAWEYKTEFGNIRQTNDDLLNKAGQERWELVAVGDDPWKRVRYVFKRLAQK